MILPSLPAISSLIRIKELLDRQGSSWKILQWTDYFMASYLISFNFLKTVVIYQAQVFQFWELWCAPNSTLNRLKWTRNEKVRSFESRSGYCWRCSDMRVPSQFHNYFVNKNLHPFYWLRIAIWRLILQITQVEQLLTHPIYKFTTFVRDGARRSGRPSLVLIGGWNFLFPICGQSYWRKLG